MNHSTDELSEKSDKLTAPLEDNLQINGNEKANTLTSSECTKSTRVLRDRPRNIKIQDSKMDFIISKSTSLIKSTFNEPKSRKTHMRKSKTKKNL